MAGPRPGGGPVLVVGVARSGTRMLKSILDSHSHLGLARESYSLAALCARHGRRVRPERLAADARRLDPRWQPDELEGVRRLPEGAGFADAMLALHAGYAAAHGKERPGHKSPEYLRYPQLAERAFPDAQYVHIVRDGRDAAVSWASMPARGRSRWRWPRGLSAFACEWRSDLLRGRRLGERVGPARYTEVRYERLVAEPEACVRELCAFLDLRFEPAMLDYWRHIDPARPLRNHPHLRRPPTQGLRDWRGELEPGQVRRFEAIAGDMLDELGYERAFPSLGKSALARGRAARALTAGRLASWDVAASLWRRSPLWAQKPL